MSLQDFSRVKELEQIYQLLEKVLEKRIQLTTPDGKRFLDAFAVRISGDTVRALLADAKTFRANSASYINDAAIAATHRHQLTIIEQKMAIFAEHNFSRQENV